jgi:O-antigen/teichoic acid export membrane protein
MNCLLAAKKVLKANLYLNVANITKTIVIIVATLFRSISIGWVIITFGVIGPVVFFLLVLLDKKVHLKAVFDAPIRREDFRFDYTFTYFVASQFFNLGLRMDLFLLSYYLTKDIVGYYGLAQKIILTILATVTSITQVLSPSFSNIKTKKELMIHIKSALLYMLIPTGLFLALSITPTEIFSLFFTQKFTQTANVSHLLALSFLIYPFFSILQLILLYTFKKPSLILIANVILFFCITFGCYFFIPAYGYLAAVVSIGVVFFFQEDSLLSQLRK